MTKVMTVVHTNMKIGQLEM